MRPTDPGWYAALAPGAAPAGRRDRRGCRHQPARHRPGLAGHRPGRGRRRRQRRPALGAGRRRGLRGPGAGRAARRGVRRPRGRRRRHRRTSARCCGRSSRRPATGRRPGRRPSWSPAGVARGRALPHPLPPGAGAGRRCCRCSRVVAIATQDVDERRDRAGHAAADPGLRGPGRPRHPRPRRAAVARDGVAVRPLPRRDARPADAGRVPPGGGPDVHGSARSPSATAGPASHTLRIAFASSAVLELVATLSVALVAVTVGVRLADGDLDLRHRAGRPAARARGLLAAAPGRRGVPRRGRGRRDLRARRRPAVALRARPTPARPGPGDLDVDDVTVHLPRPGRAGPRRRLPRRTPTGHHRRHRSVRRRQVDPARRCSPGCASPTRPAPVDGVPVGGDAWRSRVALLRSGRSSCRHHRRQRAPRRARRRRRRRLGGARAGSRSRSASGSSRRVSTPRSARTAPRSRPVSVPASPWPGSCSATGPGCCSTSRPPTSTRSPSTSSPTPSSSSPATAPSSWSPTGPPWSPSPTRWSTWPRRPPRCSRSATSRPTRRARRRSSPSASYPPSRLVLPTVLGGLASASGVALTATSGWLIVQASNQPGRPDPARRDRRSSGPSAWPGRCCGTPSGCCSHDVGPAACSPDRRVEVYDALVPLTPGRSARVAATSSPRSSTTSTACSTGSCGAGCRCVGWSSSARWPRPCPPSSTSGSASSSPRPARSAAWPTCSRGSAPPGASGAASTPGPGSPSASSRPPRSPTSW